MSESDVANSSQMEQDWDARAREAPEYFIASGRDHWEQEDFFQGGRINVENEVLADEPIICMGEGLHSMRMIEIGCGAGRMTRALAAVFGEVHGVDISGEMIALARRNLADLTNVRLYKNNGRDLAELPESQYDFAFSFIVFQHIPSHEVIESYVREVYRCLRPGAVFKFQVQGGLKINSEYDSWIGAPISLAWAKEVADRCGFAVIGATGEGTQYFWLWFRKPGSAPEPEGEAVFASFSTGYVLAGDSYRVRIPEFANQVIDVGWELPASGETGVVSSWCELDEGGEARIPVPAEHPACVVRITKVRSRTRNSRWRRTSAEIEVGRG